MAAKTSLDRSLDRINHAAESLGESDREAVASAHAVHKPREASNSSMSIDAIVAREEDLRVLREDHVRRLAASIAMAGLISPPAVDMNGRLLAGEHRRAALLLLQQVSENLPLAQAVWVKELAGEGDQHLDEEDIQRITETWKREGFDRGIPVRRMNFAVANDADRAMAVEIIENTQRLDFTRDEVVAVYEKLKKSGYKNTAGRPKKGEKALMPALSVIFGRHVRTLRHVLNDAKAPEKESSTPKTLTALKAMKRAIRSHGADLPRDVKTALRAFEDAVDDALAKREGD